MIYGYVLVEDHVIYVRANKVNRAYPGNMYLNVDPEYSVTWTEPGLLRACKAIRNEATSLYYGTNDFDLAVSYYTK